MPVFPGETLKGKREKVPVERFHGHFNLNQPYLITNCMIFAQI